MTEKRAQADRQTVIEADLALVSYLDTLLAEIDDRALPETREPAVKAIKDRADILQERPVSVPAVSDSVKPETAEDELRPPVPVWAAAPFQILMFSLSGVDLAVPLSELLGIIPLQGQISRLPGQPRWAMGVARNRDAKVVVVDTRRLLMPESASAKEEDHPYSHILLIGDGDRGLAVSALNGTQMLDREAVRWRGGNGRHPWYAGIISEKLVALVDVDGIMEMLAA
jgi:purine-binding chemotaxis protein CheW